LQTQQFKGEYFESFSVNHTSINKAECKNDSEFLETFASLLTNTSHMANQAHGFTNLNVRMHV